MFNESCSSVFMTILCLKAVTQKVGIFMHENVLHWSTVNIFVSCNNMLFFFFLMGIWVHHVKATINQRLLPSSDFISEMKVQHDDIEKILKVNVWIVSEACVLLLFQLFFLQFKNIYVWLSGNLKLCVGLIVHGCLVLWWTSNPSRLCPRTAGTGSSKPEQNKWVAGRNQNRNTVVQFDKSVI